jgi:hypothetical protein
MSNWYQRAACRGLPLRLWFTAPGESVDPGKRICQECPVKAFCLEDVLAWEGATGTTGRHGIAGGLSPAERSAEWQARKNADTAPDPIDHSRREHGSEAGYKQHRRRGEKPCPACRDAVTRAKNGRRAMQRRRATGAAA